jgi:hypothetical protein
MTERLRIVVAGYTVCCPLGGTAWHYLQYALGLKELGHEVLVLEDSQDYPFCWHPWEDAIDSNPQTGLEFTAAAMEEAGLGSDWAFFEAPAATWHGPRAGEAEKFARGADVFLNVSGKHPIRPWVETIPARVFVDTDPVFTQIRHLQRPGARERAAAHNVFLTFGENIGSAGGEIPDDGFPWRPTRQPVVLGLWEAPEPSVSEAFSTVMMWSSYDALEHEGVRYGMKSESMEALRELPGRVETPLELQVMRIPDSDRERLQEQGWRVEDPRSVSATAAAYRDYIRRSRGELSLAKDGYRRSACGWFSERSANFLAAGRPVVAQDTGFSRWLESEGGVVPFATREDAAWALEEVEGNYHRHSRLATEVAREYFDAGKVLRDLLAKCGAADG